jgi:hypothetical protein
MLFGNMNQRFFSLHSSSTIQAASAPAVIKLKDDLRLQAGRAHGVLDGDLFSLQALPGNGQAVQTDSMLLASVSEAGGLTSTLDFARSAGKASLDHVKSGWTAVPLTRTSLKRFAIHIGSAVPCQDELTVSLSSRGLRHIQGSGNDAESPCLVLAVDQNGGYCILDCSSQRVPNTPAIHPSDEESAARLVDMLEHLLKFRLVRELSSSGSFSEAFSAQLRSPSGETYMPEAETVVSHGNILFLEVNNLSARHIYVHPYVMGPLWQVYHVLNTEYEVIPPKEVGQGFNAKLRRKLKMTVPETLTKRGQTECVDILKVFVTSEPTSFLSLELPEMEAEPDADENKRLSPSRLSPGASSGESSEGWATCNFIIRTSIMKKDGGPS